MSLFFVSNSPQTPSNLISLIILVTLTSLTFFNLKLEQIIFKKAIRFVWFNNYFADVFIEFQLSYWKPSKFGREGFFKKGKVNSSQSMTAFNNESNWYRHKKQNKTLQTSLPIIFWDFWWLSTLSFHYKWNLINKLVYTSRVTRCRPT